MWGRLGTSTYVLCLLSSFIAVTIVQSTWPVCLVGRFFFFFGVSLLLFYYMDYLSAARLDAPRPKRATANQSIKQRSQNMVDPLPWSTIPDIPDYLSLSLSLLGYLPLTRARTHAQDAWPAIDYSMGYGETTRTLRSSARSVQRGHTHTGQPPEKEKHRIGSIQVPHRSQYCTRPAR